MLNSEAGKKLFPFMFTSGDTGVTMECITTRCMGWDDHKKRSKEMVDGMYVYESKDPPEGECGMKPVESYCNYPA